MKKRRTQTSIAARHYYVVNVKGDHTLGVCELGRSVRSVPSNIVVSANDPFGFGVGYEDRWAPDVPLEFCGFGDRSRAGARDEGSDAGGECEQRSKHFRRSR